MVGTPVKRRDKTSRFEDVKQRRHSDHIEHTLNSANPMTANGLNGGRGAPIPTHIAYLARFSCTGGSTVLLPVLLRCPAQCPSWTIQQKSLHCAGWNRRRQWRLAVLGRESHRRSVSSTVMTEKVWSGVRNCTSPVHVREYYNHTTTERELY